MHTRLHGSENGKKISGMKFFVFPDGSENSPSCKPFETIVCFFFCSNFHDNVAKGTLIVKKDNAILFTGNSVLCMWLQKNRRKNIYPHDLSSKPENPGIDG